MITLSFILQNNSGTILECLNSLIGFDEYISEFNIHSTFGEDTLTVEIIKEWMSEHQINQSKEKSHDPSRTIFYMYGDEKLLNSDIIKNIDIEKKYSVWVYSKDYKWKSNRLNCFEEEPLSDNHLDLYLEKILDDPLEYERRAINITFQELDTDIKHYLDISYYYRIAGNDKFSLKMLDKEKNKQQTSYYYLREVFNHDKTFENALNLIKNHPNNLDSYYCMISYLSSIEQYQLCYHYLKNAYNYDIYDNTDKLDRTVYNIKIKFNELSLDILDKLEKDKEFDNVLFELLLISDKETRNTYIEKYKKFTDINHYRFVKSNNLLENSLVLIINKIVIELNQNHFNEEIKHHLNYNFYELIHNSTLSNVILGYSNFSRTIEENEFDLFITLPLDHQKFVITLNEISISNLNKLLVFYDVEPTIDSIQTFIDLENEKIIYVGISKNQTANYLENLLTNKYQFLFISNAQETHLYNSIQTLKQIGFNENNQYVIKNYKDNKYLEFNDYVYNLKNIKKENINALQNINEMKRDGFLINLHNRKDRLLNINEQFYDILNLKRIEGIKENPGWIGCFKSHQRCLRFARYLNMSTVLVIEDDCLLYRRDDFFSEWKETKEWLDNNLDKWDVFLGGCTNLTENNVMHWVNKEKGLVALNFSTTTHFIYYNKNIFDKIINYEVNPKKYKPIDIAIPELAKERIITKVPFLAKQKEDYSDIENKKVNYDSLFSSSEKIIIDKLLDQDDKLVDTKTKPNNIQDKKIISPILMGGLSNRMFQIASAYGIAKKHDKEVIVINDLDNSHSKIDYFQSIFKGIKKDPTLNIETILKEQDNECFKCLNFPNVQENIRLLGYFQNEDYFYEYREDILNLFKPDSLLENRVKNIYNDFMDRYFIHIRRGDYVGNPKHDLGLEKEYYKKAINYIKSKDGSAKFYCFSDDINYCKNIDWLKQENIDYVEELNELESLYLMSFCYKGGIGANSTFSWWGGWLNNNENKLVIYPNKWLNGSDEVLSSRKFIYQDIHEFDYVLVEMNDGFGSQYQKILAALVYCDLNNKHLIYKSIKSIEHNYKGDREFEKKIEDFMNFKQFFKEPRGYPIKTLSLDEILFYFDNNLDNYLCSDIFKKIKNAFHEKNKVKVIDRIAIHIRVENEVDKTLEPFRKMSLDTYKILIKRLRKLYPDKEIHIFSQGSIQNFRELDDKKLIYHLNEDLLKTFLDLIESKYLVTAKSCYSILAGLLSNNTVYKFDYWYNLPKKWININQYNVHEPNKKVIEAYNDKHLGDCIYRALSFNKIKDYLKFNNIYIHFYCREEYYTQILEFIDSNNIVLNKFTTPRGYNTWIGLEKSHYNYFKYESFLKNGVMKFDDYFILQTNDLFKKMGLDITINTFWYEDEDLINRYNKLPEHFKGLDYLILNNEPHSGQYDYHNHKQYWDQNILEINKNLKIATILKLNDVLCTTDYNLSVKDIAAISTKAKNIIAVDSGPLAACLNNYTMNNANKVIIYGDFACYNKTTKGTHTMIW